MKKWIALGLCLALGACDANKFVKPEPAAESAPVEDAAVAAPARITASLDVGDVEANVFINGAVVARSMGPNVQVDQMEARNERITFTTVDISPPFPEEFWVNFQIRSQESYGKQPVVLRGRALRDESVLGEFTTILGRDASRGYKASPPFHSYSYDVLAGLESLPESILVRIEADISLLPPGTPEDIIDPASVEVLPEFQGTLNSNPIRVNFLDRPTAETAEPRDTEPAP